MKEKKLSKTAARQTVRRVLRHLSAFWPLLILSLLFSLIHVYVTLSIPRLIGDAIDGIIGKNNVDYSRVWDNLLRCAVLALIGAAVGWILSILNNRIAFGIIRMERKRVFEHIQNLPLSYLDRLPVGEIVSRVIGDVDQYADGLLLGFSQLFTGVLTILGTLYFMVVTDLRITAVVVLLTPLSLLVARYIAKRTYTLFREQSQVKGELTAYTEEMILGAKTVKLFSHQQESQQRFEFINHKLQSAALNATFYSSLVNPSTRFVNSLVYAGVALSGALTVLSGGSLGIGGLSCMLSYANQYTKPFNEISGVLTELQNALACANRVFELIDEPIESEISTDVAENKDDITRGAVTLRQVDFSYTPQKPLIQHLSLSVAPGSHIAIVGPTGCGKTTLINLIMRFYDVQCGEISVDGVNIQSMRRHDLRKKYGMVLQETWLKSGTVRDMIAFSKPNATDDEIEAAARAAHAHSFIRRLPNGYQTVLGEDGGSLSQGQKQLLCIARLMLSMPPMLILDEATSSIDTCTEMKIQDAFHTLMQGRTTFIVAHRLSTIQNCDCILVMKDGDVIEQGTHTELLKQNGFYAKLYYSQFEEND